MKKLFTLFLFLCFSFSFSQKKALFSTWIAVALHGQYIDTNHAPLPFITFTKNKIIGSSSCNRIFANYSANCKRISFSEIGGTKMLCSEPINAVERNFQQALIEVYYWKIKEDKLYFFDKKLKCVIELKEK